MLPGDFVRRGVFAGKFGKSKQLSSTYPNFFNFSDFPNTTFPIFSTKAKIPRESYHLGIFNSRRVIFTGYSGATVISILHNEKYKGDALSQKFYV